MPAPKLLMSGYFGFSNLGDEAIFEAMVTSLREECPDVQLTALVADPNRALSLNVRPIPRKNLALVTRAVLASDLVISGGGGLIQDSTGVGSVAYYLGITRLAALLGKPTMFYAQGYGPVVTPTGKRLARWWGNRLSLITVRDQESAADVRRAGITRPPLRVTADPALLLQPAPPARMAALFRENGLSSQLNQLEGPVARQSQGGPLVAVTIRPWKSLPFEAIVEALGKFHEQEKARYLIIPFHPHFDGELSSALQARLPDCSRVVGENWSPAETTGLLRCCDMVVGMRLHSLILAAGAFIPSLGLSYDPKVERFARLAGAVPLPLEEISTEKLLQALQSLLHGRIQARAMMERRVGPMIERARKTARAAIVLARQKSVEAALSILGQEDQTTEVPA